METRYIKINKDANNKIQYLKEVLPKIPANTILYKKLTGLGATYGELKADRHSIIIEPNVPVIIGKCEDSKHKADALFGVYKGVNTEDIIEYLNNKLAIGDFELQIPLIDAYNALMSDRVTDKFQEGKRCL